MNENNLEKLFAQMKAEKLSALERARLRERLISMMHGSVPTYREFSFMHFVWASSVRRIAVGVVAVLLVFSGVSYAAEGSLPGAALYAFKRQINEPLRSALAVSNKAKLELQAQLADRRIGEVSALASENRLDEKLQEVLLREAAQHATLLRISLDDTSNELNKDDAEELASHLKASREARSSLTARVLSPEAIRRPSVSKHTRAPSATSAMPMSAASSVQSVQEERASTQADSSTELDTREAVPQSPSQKELTQVEEEYDKALLILGERIDKFSKEENQARSEHKREKGRGPDNSPSDQKAGDSSE